MTLTEQSGIPTATRYNFQGAVCGDNFSDRDASVTCKSQGYATGYALKPIAKQKAMLPVVLGMLNCSGSERSLAECPRGAFVEAPSDCRNDTVAHVLCTENTGELCVFTIGHLLCLLRRVARERGEREEERERERERERETDRQIDRQTDRQTDRDRQRQRVTERDREGCWC